jgi:hypothetical protein
MSIMPYKARADLPHRVTQVLSTAGLNFEELPCDHPLARKFIIREPIASVWLDVGPGLTPDVCFVRLSFREGFLRGLFFGRGELQLAERVETALRSDAQCELVAQGDWLVDLLPEDKGGQVEKGGQGKMRT